MRTKVAVLMIMIAVVLVACGGSDESDATAVPTRFVPTATPRSTPLPPVATAVRLGTTADPLRLVFIVPSADMSSTTLPEIEQALNDGLANERLTQLGLVMTIEVQTVENASVALDAVCGSERALAWVDAFTYVAARQTCDAQPLLRVQRTAAVEHLPDDIQPDTADGVSFDVVLDATLDPLPSTLTDLSGLTFCRINAQDTVSWVYPALALQAVGQNPISDVGTIVEVEDFPALLLAVATSVDEGGCDVGAIPEGTFAELVALEDVVDADLRQDDFALLQNTWPTVPHEILIAPASAVLPADLLDSTVTQLEAVATSAAAENLAELLSYDTIEPATEAEFRSFVNWLDDTGWAMGR